MAKNRQRGKKIFLVKSSRSPSSDEELIYPEENKDKDEEEREEEEEEEEFIFSAALHFGIPGNKGSHDRDGNTRASHKVEEEEVEEEEEEEEEKKERCRVNDEIRLIGCLYSSIPGTLFFLLSFFFLSAFGP